MKHDFKIALFTDTFDETNGVAHTYRTLAAWAERHGHRLDVYAPGDGCDGVEERGSVRIFRFRRRASFEYYDGLHFSLLPNPRVEHCFSQHGPYSLVHVAAPGNLGVWGRKLAARAGLPLVGVHHTQLQDYAALRVPRMFAGIARAGSLQVLKNFYRPCRLVFAPTPRMSEFVKRVGIGRESEVFSRGVDTERFSPDHRTEPRDDKVRLLYVGRLAVEKNLDALKRILGRLRVNCAFEMTFVGDGPMKQELAKALPWAKFAGVKKGNELSEAFANGDILVFPSLTDTFGNVVNEAQASGVPCVVMDPNGPGEVIEDGSTGLLGASDERFGEAVAELIKDRKRRTAMGLAARSLAKKRDWDKVFSSLFSVYHRVSQPE